MRQFIYRQINFWIAGICIFCNVAYAASSRDSFLSKLLEEYPYCTNYPCKEIGYFDNKDDSSINYSKLIESGIPLLKYYSEALELEKLPIYYAVIPIIESRNYPKAESPVGAKGVWQLMPSTAFDMGVFRNSQIDMRTDIYLSTKAAVRFIGDLHKKYKGDPNLVLAAYNWGPANVDKYRADLYSKIPYETKKYLQIFYRIGSDLRALPPNHEMWIYPDVHYLKTVSWSEYQNISGEPNQNLFNFLNPDHINKSSWVVPTDYFYLYFGKKIAQTKPAILQPVKATGGLRCYVEDVSPYVMSYVVRQGDSISSIAKKFSLSHKENIRLRSTYSSLEAGMVIKLAKQPVNKSVSQICLQ